MILETIIGAVATRCAAFANPNANPLAGIGPANVGGAAQFKQLDEATNLPLPCAFVIPLDDSPEEPMSINATRQKMVDSFAVIVVVSNVVDEKGQTGVANVHTLRTQLWKALLGWRPSSDYNGIKYEGGSLLKLDRSRLWYQFEFGAEMEITPADGWEGDALAALPHLDGITLKIDAISPQHDPNLVPPGQPDTRIENTVPIPQTGNFA